MLLAGASLFGIGWGFVGICPGPAFVGLAIAPLAVLPFFVAMIAGSLEVPAHVWQQLVASVLASDPLADAARITVWRD